MILEALTVIQLALSPVSPVAPVDVPKNIQVTSSIERIEITRAPSTLKDLLQKVEAQWRAQDIVSRCA